ncbi:DoxX family protein [Patulibacter sp. S7RM1-6]
MSPIKQLLFPRSTTDGSADVGLLVLRLALGAVFVAHGAQKLFGAWGGGGIAGTGQAFEGVGLSPGEPLAALAGGGELIGGVLLALGLLTRVGALSVGASMAVAIVAMHLPGPFLDGYEFPLALLAAAVAMLLVGPGRLSVDAAIRARLDGAPAGTAASTSPRARAGAAD